MEKFWTFFSDKIAPNLIVYIAIGFTTLTTSMAAVKLAENAPTFTEISDNLAGISETITGDNTQGDADLFPDAEFSSLDFPAANLPTTGAATSASTAATTGSNCIIKIAGNSYNFQSLRATHTGGNVFVCGSDMTAVYQRQHGTNYTKIQRYLLGGSSGTTTATNGGTSGGTTGGSSGSTSGGSTSGSGSLCLVTIAGTTYKFFTLQSTHSGVNMFNCNTDMTSIYQRQHGTNYSRITQYKYSAPVGTTTTPMPTATAAPTPTTGAGGGSNGLCLVTIAGTTYNFYSLQTSHTGGNIFSCNTDMTTIYQRQHGTGYSRITVYKYTAPVGTTTTPLPTATAVPTPTPKVGACNIIVNGSIYNINKNNFARKHAGGDVFVCGADQTALFKSKHGTRYSMLKDYFVSKVATPTPVPTTVAPTTVAPTTVAPTTIAPTTVAPTTVAPTTVAPTTVVPTP